MTETMGTRIFQDKAEFVREYKNEFLRSVAEPFETCDKQGKYAALVRLIAGKAAILSSETQQRHQDNSAKQVYYFSMEFLIGRLLQNYLLNLGVTDIVREGLAELGEDLSRIVAMSFCEPRS